MRNVITIFRKELRSYFSSPIAYAVIGVFALLAGVFYYSSVAYFVDMGARAQMMGRGMPMNVNEVVIRPVLMNLSVIALFAIPAITMRLFAEEKRAGTIELLVTSPIRDMEIVLGKWLAATVLFATMLAVSALNVAVLFLYGKPDLPPILTGYLGLLLQGAALIAVGTFISNTTRNQIVAFIVTLGASLLLWIVDWTSGIDPTAKWSKVTAYLSVVNHLEPFAKGVLDSKDVIFFVTLAFLGLFLAARSLESLRWRS
ncbi:MAG: ABC transporter permease subunit [Bryobacteraceae bacterium]